MKAIPSYCRNALFFFALLANIHFAGGAIIYNGNANTSFGGAVGNGTLTLSDNGTTVSGTFTRGTSGNFNDSLVIYIDSVSGGFTTTGSFNDQADGLRQSISGVSVSGRSTLNFASGFTANYAIALNANTENFGGLWSLANGNNNSLGFIASVGLSPNNNTAASSYTFSFNWTDIGLTANSAQNSFRLVSTYVATSGFRSGESFGTGGLSGTAGHNTFNYSGYDTYLTAVPEPTHIALGIFGLLVAGGAVFRKLRQRRSAFPKV